MSNILEPIPGLKMSDVPGCEFQWKFLSSFITGRNPDENSCGEADDSSFNSDESGDR